MSLVSPSFSHIFLKRRSICSAVSLPRDLTLIMYGSFLLDQRAGHKALRQIVGLVALGSGTNLSTAPAVSAGSGAGTAECTAGRQFFKRHGFGAAGRHRGM